MADERPGGWLKRGARVRYIDGPGPTMRVGEVRAETLGARHASCYWSSNGSIHALDIPEWLLEPDGDQPGSSSGGPAG